MTIRNVVALFISLLSAGAALARDQILKPEQFRPRVNQQYIVGLVPHEDGLDAFWVQQNELVVPVRTRVLRTRLTAEGVVRGPATLIRDHERVISNAVHGAGPLSQALWTDHSRTLLVSPILNGAFAFPEGKFVASFVDNPRLACAGSRCVASWDTWRSERMAVILDSDGNASSAPFLIPYGRAPMSLTLDEGGIFFVRQTPGELRAARVGYDGVTRYDVSVAPTVPLTVNPTPVAVAFDGSRHIVAFVERTASPEEVRTVAISDTGVVSPPVTLMRADAPVNLGSIALAWNGTSFLLAGGYINPRGTHFISRFDAGFQPLDPHPLPAGVATRSPQIRIQVIGTSFAIGWSEPWSGLRTWVTVVSAEGEISRPVALDAVSRRRGAVRP